MSLTDELQKLERGSMEGTISVEQVQDQLSTLLYTGAEKNEGQVSSEEIESLVKRLDNELELILFTLKPEDRMEATLAVLSQAKSFFDDLSQRAASGGRQTDQRQEYDEIFCDLNAGRGNGYSIETYGSLRDLEKLGLTPETAVGKSFLFNGGLDADEKGVPADILFHGTVVEDERWGPLAIPDDDDPFFWRPV